MVTEKEYKVNGKYMGAVTLYGLSTDDKPTCYGNGSCFIEIDTGNGFFFDAENGTWYPEVESEEPDDSGEDGNSDNSGEGD